MHNDLCCYLLGLKPAYGAKEVAEEASEILMHAAELTESLNEPPPWPLPASCRQDSSMSRPPASRGPAARLTFESGGYRYSVLRHLVTHPHYDTLLLASREYAQGGPVKLVELKPCAGPRWCWG